MDEVDGLGDFVELEVVLDDAEAVDDGQQIAEEIMIKLDIKKTDLIKEAYIDMVPVNFP